MLDLCHSFFLKKNKNCSATRQTFLEKGELFPVHLYSWEPKLGCRRKKSYERRAKNLHELFQSGLEGSRHNGCFPDFTVEGKNCCFVGWTFLAWEHITASCKKNFFAVVLTIRIFLEQKKTCAEVWGFLCQILRWSMSYCFTARWNNQPPNSSLVDSCQTNTSWFRYGSYLKKYLLILLQSSLAITIFRERTARFTSQSPLLSHRSISGTSSWTYWALEISHLGSSSLPSCFNCFRVTF